MLYSERANPAKVHYLINVPSDWHDVRNCERRCRPTGDVNDYFQVRQKLCHKEVFSTPPRKLRYRTNLFVVMGLVRRIDDVLLRHNVS